MTAVANQQLQERFEAEVSELKTARNTLQNLINSKAQFLTQHNENEMVLQELQLLEEDAQIYKLIGPALIKQEKTEAVANVKKRLEFIKGEDTRLDKTIKDMQKTVKEKEEKVVATQTKVAAQRKQ
eukprot:TRINITY_DN13913_c0_g1_i1.p1 TRINITY_DN13913_c0_g1~~TRINITY_DN13913_c0_g1_i1.p1  ORF type:complete len:137 (+),score=42.16 TRINITY_DN13913_c0_g1_i1:34-411(+)